VVKHHVHSFILSVTVDVFALLSLSTMSLHDSFPAYGGRGPGDFRLGIALGSIATLFMILRVYVRLRINKFGTTALMWALLAWGLTTMTQTFGIISVLYGLGNHLTVVAETGQLHNFLLFTWITVFFFNLAIPTGKVAVAAFLMEMNQQTSAFISSLHLQPPNVTELIQS